jgi:hypothetical protein
MPAFYVYVIEFDDGVFGIFATEEEAEVALEDAKVKKCRIEGLPEIDDDDEDLVG